MRTFLFFLLFSTAAYGQHVNRFTINTVFGSNVWFYCYEHPFQWVNGNRVFGTPFVSYDLSIVARDKTTYDIYLPEMRIFEVLFYDPQTKVVKHIFIESDRASFPSNYLINCDFRDKEAIQVYADYTDQEYHVNLFLFAEK